LALHTARQALNDQRVAVADEARTVVDGLTAWAQQRHAECVAIKANAPLYACDALAGLAQQLAPTDLGQQFLAEARSWAAEPGTVRERQAQPLLSTVMKEVAKIRPGKVSDPKVAQRQAANIQNVVTSMRQLAQTYGDTRAFHDATALCDGIAVPRDWYQPPAKTP
jgi:hypothetical protein